MVNTRMLSFGLLALLLFAGRAQAYAESPTQAIKRTHARINRLLSKKTRPGTPADKRVKEQVTQQVNAFLDFEELARRALGRHWAARTEAERKEFVGILRELIERNYVKQLRTNLGYKIEYRKESTEGDKAKVLTAVKVKKNRRTTEIIIEYKMRKANSGWMVYDVVTDEVSIVRNYRSQFNRIIRKESYEALVKKMRDKLAEKS
jgi:phospholipid transport system substrate-binding protein